MPRPTRCRRIGRIPAYRSFSPDDVEPAESVLLSIDEYEALRLLDGEGMTQEECASSMNIARTTVTAIYDSARKKIADMMVNGKRLLIAGGCCEYEPIDVNQDIIDKRSSAMRVAVTYENGEIFQHFGHTEQFKIYDIEDGRIVGQQVIDTNGYGHGALAGFLNAVKADVLICGGIGMGAQMALADAGITLCAGVSGSADAAAKAFAEGKLESGSEANCNCHEHHHEGGDCGHGHCGEHGSEEHHCGCH